jgi:DnaJ like chaperone protein
VGAALGGLAGHLVDEKLGPTGEGDPQPVADPPADATAVAARFFSTTFEVMGHVAKADGRVSQREIDAARGVMADFRLDSRQVAAAIECFTRGKSPGYDLTRAIMALRRSCAGRPDLLRVFLEIQMRAAIAGADLRGPSRPLLTRIAATLGVNGMEFAHLEAVLRLRQGAAGPGARGTDGGAGRAGEPRMSVAEAYQILEVAAVAPDDEVTRAYRRQLSRHHPDKLKANGLPESMIEHAKQRTQQVIEAWDVIRQARGLKT